MEEAGQRIKQVRLHQGLNQAEFADRLGIGQAYLSALETGHRDITGNVLKALHREFEVSLDWIITGTGEMNITIRNNSTPAVAPPDEALLGHVSRLRLVHAFSRPDNGPTLHLFQQLPLADLLAAYRRVEAGLDRRSVRTLLPVAQGARPQTEAFAALDRTLDPLVGLQKDLTELLDLAQYLTEAWRTYADQLADE